MGKELLTYKCGHQVFTTLYGPRCVRDQRIIAASGQLCSQCALAVLQDIARREKEMYEIRTLTEHGWDAEPIGQNNEFATVWDAEAAIETLRELGDDWSYNPETGESQEYRVFKV